MRGVALAKSGRPWQQHRGKQGRALTARPGRVGRHRMYRLLLLALLSSALLLGWSSIASAQSVERSGDTYHVAVCPGPVAPRTARCHAHVVTDRAGVPRVASVIANATPPGYGPADLRSAYKITGAGSATTRVAIVDAYGYASAEADLAIYRSQYGLPACTTANGCFSKYNQRGLKGPYPKQSTGWAQETALDLDLVSAMCPLCRIILVEAHKHSFA